MKAPTTPEETLALHHLMRNDPQAYLRIVDGWIAQDPADGHAYFDRHLVLLQLGQPLRALEDLNRAIEIDPLPVRLQSRGDVHRRGGDYAQAIADYGRAEALDPDQWAEDGVGLLFQADCHARLGDEAAALACCARLPDDFWTPGLLGAPAGGKAEIADQVRVLAGRARGGRDGAAALEPG